MKAVRSLALMVAAAFLLAFSVPAPAFSEMMDLDKMGDMMGMCVEHADKIGLSADQVMKMKPKHSEMQKKNAQFKADTKIAKIDFMDIMEVKDFDLDKARAAVKKIADIKTAHQLEMLKMMKEMRTILTNDQFKSMKQMMMTMKMSEHESPMMKMDKH